MTLLCSHVVPYFAKNAVLRCREQVGRGFLARGIITQHRKFQHLSEVVDRADAPVEASRT